jgi:hypothetical protein
MRITTAALALFMLGASLVSCGGGQAPGPTAAPRAEAYVVPAGSRFSARLNNGIGTSVTQPGQRFTATVSTPLTNARGLTVVPAGAIVHGTVVGLDRGPAPNLRLSITSIDAGHGSMPLFATIGGAPGPHMLYTAAPVYATDQPYSAILLPSGPAPTEPIGGGPRDFDLPVGTPFVMILTRPFTYTRP